MIILDSDVIIDYLKGKKEAVEAVNKFGDEAATTEISLFEIFYGVYLNKNFDEEERLSAEEFFNSINVFSFDSGCGEISAKILASLDKQGLAIEQNDCFIASVTLKNGFNKILTGNKKHFNRIKGLKVVGY